MKKNKTYTITCDESQLRNIVLALNTCTRMYTAQLNLTYLMPLYEEFVNTKFNHDSDDNKEYYLTRDQINTKLSEIKKLIWNIEQNEQFGLGHNEKCDVMYHIYKNISDILSYNTNMVEENKITNINLK